MSSKVRAYYVNGVFTPLEPLDLAEGELVDLDISEAFRGDLDSAIREAKGILEIICQLSDGHPKKYKLFLDAEDALTYLEGERKFRDRPA